MVHALELAHQYLKPGGRLIDIHPTEKPPPVLVRLGSEDHPVGTLQETDDFIEYKQASAALAEACSRGLFRVERQAEFSFAIYTEDLDDLLAYLAERWDDAVVPPRMKRRINHYYSTLQGEKEVVVREQVGIACLTRTLPALAL